MVSPWRTFCPSLTCQSLLRMRKVLVLERIMLVAFLLSLGILFLPWRQTIPGKGTVTALRPQDRPQTIQNQIGGRIERWPDVHCAGGENTPFCRSQNVSALVHSYVYLRPELHLPLLISLSP